MNKEYLLRRFSTLLNIGIFCADEKHLQCFCDSSEYNPICKCEPLRRMLWEGADAQKEPYIFMDEYMVYFACIRSEGQYFMIGPMSLELLNCVELHQFYKKYGIQEEMEKQLKHFRFSEILDVVEMLGHILEETEYEDDKLIAANQIVADSKKQEETEKIIFEIKEAEEALYHHTYQEERKLLDCVREGNVDGALRYTRSMDVDLGKLSEKEINHWRNAAIVGITLCTRAAIEGGISPSVAYRLSDFYIQKCDSCKDIARLLAYRNQAVQELTTRVAEKKQDRTSSSYVEQCRDYVNKHYREKIYLNDIADALGISSGYLSRLFRTEMGMCLQDYITFVRIEHAANLLTYSEESIADIAEYVSFSSQSYMGKMFKAYKGVTPRKYREQHKPKEFTSKISVK